MLTCPIVIYLTWVTGTEIADDDSRWMDKNSGPCVVMSTDGGFYTVSCTALEYFACEQGRQIRQNMTLDLSLLPQLVFEIGKSSCPVKVLPN